MSDKMFTEQDQKERDRAAFDILRETGQYPSAEEVDARVASVPGDAGMCQRGSATAAASQRVDDPHELNPRTTQERELELI